ncbi:MAG: molecular chaperone DnaJ [Patescibacteria group bacterium]|nr:molecular chaperone DnaJ [Patescibacteria group bacterium]
MSKDYYNILGVNKNASQDDIKKAFRKKAHQCHPDKAGGNEAKFKEINEAYQILGDTKKRAQYDQFGSAFEHAQAGGGFSGFDGFRDFSGFANGFSTQGGQASGWNINEDDLGDIFSGIGDAFGFGMGGRKPRAMQGSDIQVLLTIEFNEAVFGAEKEISLRKTVKCDRCKGNMAEPGSKIETCKVCGGSGRVTRAHRTILGSMQVQTICESCAGKGKIYTKKCSKCFGAGIIQESVKLNIKIPAGIDNGETIRLSGQGEAGENGAPSGDLYLEVRVNPDPRFKREGYDIISKAEINFTQAALSDKIDIMTVDGHVKLKIPEGTQSGKVFRLRGKGVPHLRGRGRGDQLVEVVVKTPTSLNRKQKKMLEELNI